MSIPLQLLLQYNNVGATTDTVVYTISSNKAAIVAATFSIFCVDINNDICFFVATLCVAVPCHCCHSHGLC